MRLLSNKVMLLRIENEFSESGKIKLVRSMGTGGNSSVIFKVIDVGPGGFVMTYNRKGRARWKFVKPEVEPGDMCVSYHQWNQDEGAPQTHFLDSVDGRGRVVLDCRHVVLKWNNQTQKYEITKKQGTGSRPG